MIKNGSECDKNSSKILEIRKLIDDVKNNIQKHILTKKKHSNNASIPLKADRRYSTGK